MELSKWGYVAVDVSGSGFKWEWSRVGAESSGSQLSGSTVKWDWS